MSTRVRSGPYDFADFLELVQEDQKADLLDGVIYLAPPDYTDHNQLLLWLGTLLGPYVDGRELGRLTINKVAFRLSAKTAPEPDLGFVSAAHTDRIKPGYVDGPPDLAVEIVSPDSVDRDYHDKRGRYEEAGVGEYWIIDPDEKAAVFLVRREQGFVEARLDEHVFRSRVVPGFEIEVRWLWQRPLPSAFSIVKALLERASDRPVG